MEVNQTLDRLLRLIDEHIEPEPEKGVLAAEWLMCQILVLLPRVNGKMLGLKMEGAPDARPVEVDQTLALVSPLNQTLALVSPVNDEVIGVKDGGHTR